MSKGIADKTTTRDGVSEWPTYPTLYEISTWVWLTDLSRKYGKAVVRPGR
jgi:hypothetical protein